jgi:hypothetical protein
MEIDLNSLKFSELDDIELRKCRYKASEQPLSPFAQWMLENREVDFYQKGQKLDKWEVYWGLKTPDQVKKKGGKNGNLFAECFHRK